MSESEWFRQFVAESNRIEGITRAATDAEMEAMADFVLAPVVTIDSLAGLVTLIQPGARLRDKPGLNVRVGDHTPVKGGPWVRETLGMLLRQMDEGKWTPYRGHEQYETLHPFTDGNGRSGRLLWLRQHTRNGTNEVVLRRGFLHSWYYESLSTERRAASKEDEG